MIVGTSKRENVLALLAQLNGEVSFRLQEGPLWSWLREAVFEELDRDTVEILVGREDDVFVSISCQDGAETVIDCRIECDGAEHLAEVNLASLTGRHLHELADRLLRLLETRKPAGQGVDGDVVIRRRAVSDRYDIFQASQKLKVSADWLKGAIPCTEYHYDQVRGRTVIREYFWSRELIDRLARVKERRPAKDDIAYVAAACCDGDIEWAREIIRALGRSNALAPRSAGVFIPPRRTKIISRQFINDPSPRRKKDSPSGD